MTCFHVEKNCSNATGIEVLDYFFDKENIQLKSKSINKKSIILGCIAQYLGDIFNIDVEKIQFLLILYWQWPAKVGHLIFRISEIFS